ncbi:hypothetical protein IFR04_002625 [Cadophora malorum]|uniref:Uncharacterized protein n=1 Tax=Cadophora malorum TaxID=108018 RepID=A0A8H8BU91_9HELO|nr:hypothetical protein IFR04_002625 [Cadophora malorum]
MFQHTFLAMNKITLQSPTQERSPCATSLPRTSPGIINDHSNHKVRSRCTSPPLHKLTHPISRSLGHRSASFRGNGD